MPKRRYGIKARRGAGSIKRRRLGYRAKRRGIRRLGRSRTSISRFRGSAYPRRLMVKLKYLDNFLLTLPTSGATAVAQVFRGNSIFDPDFTGAGHQPYASDIYAQMYKYYRVYGSKITVTPVLTLVDGSTYRNAYKLYIVPGSDSTVVNSATLDEMPGITRRAVRLQYTRQPAVSRYSSTARARATTRSAISGGEEYRSQFGANPSFMFYWVVAAKRFGDAALAAGADTLALSVSITYYVELSDPIWQQQS